MKHFQKYNCMPTASLTSTLSIQLHENISMGQENFEKISEAREIISSFVKARFCQVKGF